MIRHAFRATPWPLLLVGAALVPVLLRLVQEKPLLLWPLEGVAVGILAGTAVWCFDEPAAAIVDSTPRGLGWRTAARTAGVLVLAGTWLGSVRWTEAAYFDHAGHVAGQGVAALLASVAYVTWRRSRGVAEPARAAAAAVVPAAAYLALARPLEERFPVFPFLWDGPWRESVVLWTLVAAGATVVLAAALDPLTFRRRRRGAGRTPRAAAS